MQALISKESSLIGDLGHQYFYKSSWGDSMFENHHSGLVIFKEAAAAPTGNLTEMQILWSHTALADSGGEVQQFVAFQAFQVIVMPLMFENCCSCW